MKNLNKSKSANKGKKSSSNKDVKPLPQVQELPLQESPQTLPTIEPITLPTDVDVIGQMLTELFATTKDKVKIVTKRQILNNAISRDVMGLGSWYSALVQDEINTLAFLEDQKSKGKKINPDKVRILLFHSSKEEKIRGFNLFKSFLNDKEKELQKFTANQSTGILLRACLVD